MTDIKHLVYFLELIVLESAIALCFERRKHFWLRLLLPIAAIGIGLFFVPRISNTYFFIAVVTAIFLLTSAIWLFGCKTSIYNVLFAGIVAHASEHFINKVFTLFYRSIFPVSYMQYYITIYSIVTSVICVAAWFAIWFLLTKKVKENGKKIVDNKWLLFVALVFLVSAIVVSAFSDGLSFGAERSHLGFVIASIYAIIVCLLIIVILTFMVGNNKLKNDLLVSQALILQRNEQYEYSKAAIDLVNIKYHDLKYKLEEARTSANGINDSILTEIENAMNIYGSAIKTGNEVLDVILTDKSLFCEKNEIVFSCIADGSQLAFINSTDLYSLFGNAIDNSIEAVMKLDNANERRISLQVKTAGKFLSVRIENKYEGDIAFVNGLPKTGKGDESYHGFGIKSINLIVKKYNGTMVISTDNGNFLLKILFPLQ